MNKIKSVRIPPVFRKRDLWLCVMVIASSGAGLLVLARSLILPVLCLAFGLESNPEETVRSREESFLAPVDMRAWTGIQETKRKKRRGGLTEARKIKRMAILFGPNALESTDFEFGYRSLCRPWRERKGSFCLLAIHSLKRQQEPEKSSEFLTKEAKACQASFFPVDHYYDLLPSSNFSLEVESNSHME